MSWKNSLSSILIVLFAFIIGCNGQRTFTVPEVIEQAESLNGKTIRVRGFAYLWMDPSQAEMWMTGGCIPKTDPSYRQGYVEGWLTLYVSAYPDNWGGDNAPRDQIGVKISESSFHCEGDYCKITCSPFEVIGERMYEFAGTLQVQSDSEFVLQNLDLDQSRQLVDGEWILIQRGDFAIAFP